MEYILLIEYIDSLYIFERLSADISMTFTLIFLLVRYYSISCWMLTNLFSLLVHSGFQLIVQWCVVVACQAKVVQSRHYAPKINILTKRYIFPTYHARDVGSFAFKEPSFNLCESNQWYYV